VFVLRGSALPYGGDVYSISFGVTAGPAGWGTSVASGFDLDGDAANDVAIGSPLEQGSSPYPEGGFVAVVRASGFPGTFWFADSLSPGEHMGTSVSASHDYDGDGVVDFVVGAPDWHGSAGTEDGRTYVLSGEKLLHHSQPQTIYVFTDGATATPLTEHFGACVRASDDLNRDGVGDILVGAPDFHVVLPYGPSRGSVGIYSGATGARLGGLIGTNQDRLGDALLGAVEDYDGDGFPEFVVAGSTSDNPLPDCGVLKCARLFPASATFYCTGKVNSLGCTPSVAWTTTPFRARALRLGSRSTAQM
jgi:hypothetical protein